MVAAMVEEEEEEVAEATPVVEEMMIHAAVEEMMMDVMMMTITMFQMMTTIDLDVEMMIIVLLVTTVNMIETLTTMTGSRHHRQQSLKIIYQTTTGVGGVEGDKEILQEQMIQALHQATVDHSLLERSAWQVQQPFYLFLSERYVHCNVRFSFHLCKFSLL